MNIKIDAVTIGIIVIIILNDNTFGSHNLNTYCFMFAEFFPIYVRYTVPFAEISLSDTK